VQLSVGVSALNVTVHQLSRYGDVDVYIQRDTFPTEREYALADTTTDHDMYLQVANPPPGRWYIGLFGYWRVEYSVQADIISMSCCCLSAPPSTAVDFDQHSSRCLVDCPVDCGPHGRCSGRTCLCTEPFVGEACDTCMVCCSVSHTISLVSLTSLPPLSHTPSLVDDRQLSSGVGVAESVASGEWKYFHISVVPDTDLDIHVLEDGDGDVDIVCLEICCSGCCCSGCCCGSC
jgi:hypothetical protein